MYKISSFALQKVGRRHTVCEDAFVCVDQIDDNTPNLSLYAVLDGHGDEKAAEFVRDNVKAYLTAAEGFDKKDYVTALRKCIRRLHDEIVDTAASKGGTTLSLALVDRKKFVGQTILAFLGDSPIFIRRRHLYQRESNVFQAFSLHDTSNPRIVSRVSAASNGNGILSPPWESRRCPPRGINVYGSIGDALYEPFIIRQFVDAAKTLRDPQQWQTVKKHLEESETMSAVARRQAALHSVNTLAFYLSDNAIPSPGDVSPIQREPDIMSIATSDIDMIVMGSDGAFPRWSFGEVMTLFKSVDYTLETALRHAAETCIAKTSSDDQTVLVCQIQVDQD